MGKLLFTKISTHSHKITHTMKLFAASTQLTLLLLLAHSQNSADPTNAVAMLKNQPAPAGADCQKLNGLKTCFGFYFKHLLNSTDECPAKFEKSAPCHNTPKFFWAALVAGPA